jgi:arsenate reductase (glutaredoxin)
VISAVGLNDLIDKNSKEYERLNMGHIFTHSVREEILFNNPKLCKTPIVRDGKNATVGYVPEIWKTWE